jgi:hypothetical protein
MRYHLGIGPNRGKIGLRTPPLELEPKLEWRGCDLRAEGNMQDMRRGQRATGQIEGRPEQPEEGKAEMQEK